MYSFCAYVASLASVLPGIIALAVPVDIFSELTPRDNKFDLKCGNAPSITAGDMLDPSSVPKPLPNPFPASGSNEQWFGQLWCTPGTTTYTFFNMGELRPPPLTYTNYGGALQSAIDSLKGIPDGQIPDRGYWTVQPPGTNLKISVINSKQGQWTYGILGSVLTGLLQYVDAGYHDGHPIVFQGNDGQWGEIGIGYVGMVNPNDGSCIYIRGGGKTGDCADVMAGKVID